MYSLKIELYITIAYMNWLHKRARVINDVVQLRQKSLLKIRI